MLQDKLGRLSSHPAAFKVPDADVENGDRYQKIARLLGGELCSRSNGSFVRVIRNLDSTYVHGRQTIGGRLDGGVPRNAHFTKANYEEVLPAENMLFFDMETTGLGGSGTVPFLIGFGSVIPDGFQVRQYFLPDYPDEEAMLEEVHTELTGNKIIVSYNGKAFDVPILTDRMIIHRVDRELRVGGHLDLLHPTRRLYRRRLRHCNLVNVEQNILGFLRRDDIPGELIPSIYFNWLSNSNPTLLKGVLEHNFNDIVSLFFVMYHIVAVNENPSGELTDPDDILSLARILEASGEHMRVCRMLEDLEDFWREDNRSDIFLLQSLSYKRSGSFDKAAAILERIATDGSPEEFQARIELAKYYEHRAKNPEKALLQTLRAQKICPARPYMQEKVRKRINRLNNKLSRLQGR
jgi:uncharacterized protein YprB with RNaseH-like and TPR domain